MRKQQIAVVEDDEDVREFILAFFRAKEMVTKGFGSAIEFLESIAGAADLPDVVISDLRLPDVDGVELVKRLKEQGIELPLIMLTADASSQNAIEAIEAGAYDFLVKPLNFPQLQVSVERALHFGQMQAEVKGLKAVLDLTQSATGIIGKSPGLRRAVDLAKRVASSPASIIISGETGTGKEVIAKAVHQFGCRAKEPFVAINCSAIPEGLLESELFGHAKGAFTGAVDKKVGLFEEAGAGTLFLDEIGDLSLPLQSKLLRVIQERKIRRIGEAQDRRIGARIISATHKDLKKEVSEKRFREDLYFRLSVIPILIPPLRERREDIPPLAEYFLRKFAVMNGKNLRGYDKGAMEHLLRNPWPGNVRELENAVERAVVLAESTQITLEDLQGFEEPPSTTEYEERPQLAPVPNEVGDFFISAQDSLPSLDSVTAQYIQFALCRNGGAKDKTAREIGIDRKTLYRRLSSLDSQTSAAS
jgi:DNA-binding NtrC family response regulator